MRKVTLEIKRICYEERLEELLKEMYDYVERGIEVEIDDRIDLEKLKDWDYGMSERMNQLIDDEVINNGNDLNFILCGLEYEYEIKSVEEVEVVK